MLQSTPAAGLHSVASTNFRLRLPRALLSRTIPPGVGWSGKSLSVLTRFVRQPLVTAAASPAVADKTTNCPCLPQGLVLRTGRLG